MKDVCVPSLPAMLGRIPDPRKARGRRHPWLALLLVVVGALLAGANSQRAIARWGADLRPGQRRQLGFTRPAPPSEATLRRLLQRVDVGRLERVLAAWQQQLHAAVRRAEGAGLEMLAIDGKALRGAWAARHGRGRPPPLLSAYCPRHRQVLGEVAVPVGTTEGRTLPALLRLVPLAETVVTLDAHFTQSALAALIGAAGGAYLMVVKGNTPYLRRLCRAATDRPLVRPCRQYGTCRTEDRAHGRWEERTLQAADALDIPWPYARQVLRLHRRRIALRTGEVRTDQTVYGLTALAPEQASPTAALAIWRSHWGQENGLHWVRDVVFGEDRSTVHTGTAPQALAAFRNLALVLLYRWRGLPLTAAREHYAHHPGALLGRLCQPMFRL